MDNIIKISKSELKKISFSENEVLDRASQIGRDNQLKGAILMKKDGSGKVDITFQSKNRGKFRVISPILTAGEEFLVLKGGQTIAIKSITSIKF